MSLEDVERRSECPIAFALEVFGDRWTLLVIRDLGIRGKRSYSELLASEEGIATNVLADRLSRLEYYGIVKKEQMKSDRRRSVYSLTKAGVELLPIILEIFLWSAKYDPNTVATKAFVRKAKRDKQKVLDGWKAELKRN